MILCYLDNHHCLGYTFGVFDNLDDVENLDRLPPSRFANKIGNVIFFLFLILTFLQRNNYPSPLNLNFEC